MGEMIGSRVAGIPSPLAESVAGMKPYNFKETDESSVEVEMYGRVVENRPINYWTGEPDEGLYIVLAEFLKDLDGFKDKENITFRINSVGGDLYAGISICNRISELKGNTVTIVDGLAASAASIILQGGKKRKAYAGSQVMVHGASTFMLGSYSLKELQDVEKRIEGGNRAALETYAARTGKEKGYIRCLMDREEWMTGQEAVENGFIDEVIKAGDAVRISMSADRLTVVSNGVPVPARDFRRLPKGIAFRQEAPGQGLAGMVHGNRNTGGTEAMNVEELKQKYPELVRQVEAEAAESARAALDEESIRAKALEEERARMKEIEEIEGQIADKALLSKAKYGSPMTAQELAFTAMKGQKNKGVSFLEGMMRDSEGSGANNVSPTPNQGYQPRGGEEMEDINKGAALIAGLAE